MFKIRYFIFAAFIFFSALFIFVPSTSGQTKFYTKRLSNELRQGPANYYPLIGIVPKNTELTSMRIDDGWYQVQLGTELAKSLETQVPSAWISKYCLIEKPREQENKQLKITTKIGTPSSVAAAIRGFAIRFKRTSINNIDALLEKNPLCFTPDEYNAFVLESRLTQSAEIDRALRERYDGICDEYDVSLNESMLGFNVAAEIASKGLANNPALEKYINLVGTLITQHSHLYDRSFRIYVLDSSIPEAYSTPGGIILISLCLIQTCTSEAELAAILAHEMTHIVQHHGTQEIQKRSHKIRAEEAFADLDKATGNVADSTETELEEYMQEAYDSVVKPRLLTYEEEADRGATVLLVQTGYDPTAVSSIIKKIPAAIPRKENDLEDNPFAKREYEQRYQSVASFIHEYFRQTQGATNINRFEKYCHSN
jgi:hypothetical protein